MKKIVLITAALTMMGGACFAQGADTPAGDTAKKEQQDHPGTSGGNTVDPTAKPTTSAPGDKQSMDLPKGGSTETPTAKPNTSAPGDKQKQDNPGVR
jgi:hypothetical protein